MLSCSTEANNRTVAIDVKQATVRHGRIGSGAQCACQGSVFHELHALWCRPERNDEYIGTLVNAWLA